MPETPVEDAYYYDIDDASKKVLRCLLVLPNGDAVLATSGSARVVSAAQLVRVQGAANDAFVRLRTIVNGLSGPKAAEAAALLAILESWARRMPPPSAEEG